MQSLINFRHAQQYSLRFVVISSPTGRHSTIWNITFNKVLEISLNKLNVQRKQIFNHSIILVNGDSIK